MLFFYISLSIFTVTLVRSMPIDDAKNEIVESTTKKLRDRWVIFFYDEDFVPSISLLPSRKTFQQDGEARIDTHLDSGVRNSTRDTLLVPLLRAVRSSSTGTTATVIIGKLIEQLRNIGSKFVESLDVERFWNANGTRFDEYARINENSIASNKTKRLWSDRATTKLTLVL